MRIRPSKMQHHDGSLTPGILGGTHLTIFTAIQGRAMMKRTLAMLTLIPFLVACASATTIRSSPSGAKVFLEGQYIGDTPVVHEDMDIAGSNKKVVLKHDGYRDQVGTIRKEEFKIFPLVAGLIVLIPLLWVTGYPEEYHFILEKE
jgi:hypothetical protein